MRPALMKIIVNGAIAGLIGGIGLALICVYASWQVAIGVFLLLWANNIK